MSFDSQTSGASLDSKNQETTMLEKSMNAKSPRQDELKASVSGAHTEKSSSSKSSRRSKGTHKSGKGSVASSKKEEVKEALLENHGFISKGLNKLGAYVLEENDENKIAGLESPSVSKATNDEDNFSLHLSRNTGTGSQQLELWMKEVNIAVGRVPEAQSQGSVGKPRSKNGTPRHKSLDSPANCTVKTESSAPRPRHTLSPVMVNLQEKLNPVTPTWYKDGESQNENDNSLKEKREKHNTPRHTPVAKKSGKERIPTPYSNGQIDKHSSFSTPKSKNNSRHIMESIEGKYKSLRENLIQENAFDGDLLSEEEEEYDSHAESQLDKPKSRQMTNPVQSVVSAVLAPNNLPMNYSVRDHFSLGMLSTGSSGILSATNSWSTNSSFESGRSESSFPTRGCGIFLCD